MQTEIIIAGFGGQGIMFAGQVLAYAAMDEGFEVTWIPSYGPEMRGGTANSAVVISDNEIGSPMVRTPDALIAMNLPSLEKYEKNMKPGGLVVVNSTLVNRPASRTDIQVALVPASQLAEELGERRLTNMVMLGTLLANLKVLPVAAVSRAMENHLPASSRWLIPANKLALERGSAYLSVTT
ncbi:MAG: 2-oxoacid:acceptor oxidoreductase family protein [Anaerolineaceae bacterium]|nr:2-oxoacid:acceptor oxidoreductase family protein [Anaerolineaceae bacterium]